jgi:hypothetical protein
MTSETRHTTYPADSEDINLVCVKGPKEEYPDFVLSREIRGYTPYFEAISKPPNTSRRNWNPFQHYKSERVSPGAGSAQPVYAEVVGYYPTAYSVGTSQDPFVGYVSNSQFAYSFPFGDPGSLDLDTEALYVPDGSGNIVPTPGPLGELESRAIQTLLPSIKAELSLPNFLIELKDFRSVIATIKGVYTSSSFRAALSYLLVPKNLSLAALMRTAAGSYLNLQFNWLSLLSDIARIYQAMLRTESRMNDLVTRTGRVQTKHFHFAWQEYKDVDSDWQWHGRVGYQTQWLMSEVGSRRVISYSPSVFHAEIQFNYNLTGYQTEHARLLSYLDALGINLNPAIIWNALPWSFVVDWVIGLGPYLDTLKVSNMEPQINIHRYLWSISRKRQITVTTAIRNAYDDGLEYRSTLPPVIQTAYRRQPSSVPVSLIESSGLTLKEVSLGSALVLAQKRRRN